MENLEHVLVDHQVEEGLEIDARRQVVDQNLGVAAGDLNETQARPEGLLAHEFGIDRDKRCRGEIGTGGFQIFGRCNEMHGWRI